MATNTTRKYSDLDAIFRANFVTKDISVLKDTAAIKFAVKSLVLTRNFERPFQSSIGSQAYRLLFEPMDDFTKITLSKAIRQSIINHEPREDVTAVEVFYNDDNNAAGITIDFIILSTNVKQSIDIALERTR